MAATSYRFKAATRNEFAAQSSGASYATKGEAIRRFDAVLGRLNLTLRASDVNDFHGHEGRRTVSVVEMELGDETDHEVGAAIFSWYLLESTGRWEIIGYLA